MGQAAFDEACSGPAFSMTRARIGVFLGAFVLAATAGCKDNPLPPRPDAADAGGSGGSSTGGAGGGGGAGGAATGGMAGGGAGGIGTGGVGSGGVGAGGAGGAGSGGSGAGGATVDGGQDAPCECGAFAPYRMCCGGSCINPQNDPLNCGGCNRPCTGDRPFCDNGVCAAAPCESTTCSVGGQCCGTSCCGTGQRCCRIEGPIQAVLTCHTPTAEHPGCPPGCAPLCISDRNLKRDFAEVDAAAVLAKLRALPITTWRYEAEPEHVRHLGPMAQDFRSAFGLGNSERAFFAVDAHGVTMAALQALARRVEEQGRQIEALLQANRQLGLRCRER